MRLPGLCRISGLSIKGSVTDFIVGQTQEDLYGPEGSPEQIGWSDGDTSPASSRSISSPTASPAEREGSVRIFTKEMGRRRVSGDPVLDQSFRPASRDEQGVGGAERAKAEVVTTLRHEVLGHYGLDTFTPSDKEALLQKLIDAKQEKWIAPVWQQIAGDSFMASRAHCTRRKRSLPTLLKTSCRRAPSRHGTVSRPSSPACCARPVWQGPHQGARAR